MAGTDFTIVDALDHAGDLIRRGWHQRGYARDASGAPVSAEDDRAASWCATGAIWAVARKRAAPGQYLKLVEGLCGALDEAIGEFRTCWNDRPERTQAEVVAAFRKAAADERAKLLAKSEWLAPETYLAADCGKVEA